MGNNVFWISNRRNCINGSVSFWVLRTKLITSQNYTDLNRRNNMSKQPSELIHAMVLRELQDGIVRDGLWAQAMVESGSNTAMTQSIYIRLRAASMQDEAKNLLLKQIQTGIKQDNVKPKDFLSALDLKKK